MLAACKANEISNVKWTATQIIHFLELLKKYECLWRLTDKDRKNRHCRDVAFEHLLAEAQEIVGPSDLDLITMKSKMKNLKTVYSRELAKVLESEKHGDTYVPGLRWYYVADSFLRHSKEAKEMSLLNADINEFLKNELNEASISDTECETGRSVDTSHDYSKDSVVNLDDVSSDTVTPTSDAKRKIERNALNHLSSNGVTISSCSNPKPTKRKLENGSVVESSKIIKTNCDPEDQFFAFGLYVAAELRHLSDETQLKLAKHYINSILFDASMSSLLPP